MYGTVIKAEHLTVTIINARVSSDKESNLQAHVIATYNILNQFK